MAPVGVCTAIISFCSVKIVQVFFASARVFFRLNNQTDCYVSKTFVFQCIKGNTLGKYPTFLGFVCMDRERSRKIENPFKCSACVVHQKIVTGRFSGNALISTEPLVRIS